MMRTLASAAAGVWLGGMIVIAIVASTTFGVLRTTDVSHPNTIAGKVMAKNFERFDRVQLACGGILGTWQAVALLAGQRSKRDIGRTVLIAAAVTLMLVSVLYMTPKIVALQPTLSSAESDAAVKAAFDEFHQTAVRLSQASLLFVLAIVLEMAWPQGKKVNL
ncbi:MAG: DUF4149 domain-containing protein [Planctomycetes bacterium]|nr:DUF4149 domain-containing protein [Planctomycetota bacterium]